MVPLTNINQDWLTHTNYKNYGATSSSEYKKKCYEFFVNQLPQIIEYQEVKDVYTKDRECAYELLCHKFGVADREKLSLKQLEQKFGLTP